MVMDQKTPHGANPVRGAHERLRRPGAGEAGDLRDQRRSGRRWRRATQTRSPGRVSREMAYAAPALRPKVVATAAPVTPILGNGRSPKIRKGASAMFSAFAIKSKRMGMAARTAEDGVDDEGTEMT